jgi:hypothetical protein
VSSQLEQLRLSSVEREFRRRVAEYHRQNGDESHSVNSAEERYAPKKWREKFVYVFHVVVKECMTKRGRKGRLILKNAARTGHSNLC